MERAGFPDFTQIAQHQTDLRQAGVGQRRKAVFQQVPVAGDQRRTAGLMALLMVGVIDEHSGGESRRRIGGQIDLSRHRLAGVKQRGEAGFIVIAAEFGRAVVGARQEAQLAFFVQLANAGLQGRYVID